MTDNSEGITSNRNKGEDMDLIQNWIESAQQSQLNINNFLSFFQYIYKYCTWMLLNLSNFNI